MADIRSSIMTGTQTPDIPRGSVDVTRVVATMGHDTTYNSFAEVARIVEGADPDISVTWFDGDQAEDQLAALELGGSDLKSIRFVGEVAAHEGALIRVDGPEAGDEPGIESARQRVASGGILVLMQAFHPDQFNELSIGTPDVPSEV